MPKFKIECVCQATIRETWHAEFESEDALRAHLEENSINGIEELEHVQDAAIANETDRDQFTVELLPETASSRQPNILLDALILASKLLEQLNCHMLNEDEDLHTLAVIHNAIEAAQGGACFCCTGCNRPEEECSEDPCKTVQKERAEGTEQPTGMPQRTKAEDEAYQAWRTAEALWEQYCRDGIGDGYELAKSCEEAQRHFVQVYGHAS